MYEFKFRINVIVIFLIPRCNVFVFNVIIILLKFIVTFKLCGKSHLLSGTRHIT